MCACMCVCVCVCVCINPHAVVHLFSGTQHCDDVYWPCHGLFYFLITNCPPPLSETQTSCGQYTTPQCACVCVCVCDCV